MATKSEDGFKANKYVQDVFNLCSDLTKRSNALPTGEDYPFNATSKSFKDTMKKNSYKLLSMMQSLMEMQNPGKSYNLVDATDADDATTEHLPAVIAAVDGLLEKVDSYVDLAKGLKTKDPKISVNKAQFSPKVC